MKINVICMLLCAVVAQAQKFDTLYQSKYAIWVTPDYNLAASKKYKANIDSITTELDKAIPLITTYLGISPIESPQRVQVDSGTEGMGGWAGGGDVGYQISDFYGRPVNGDGLRWIRGVIIGEVINASTGGVTSDWPRDWWVDDVWYFPGFMAGEILKTTVDSTFSDYWLTSEHYPTYPVYNIFTSLLKQFGWPYYKNFFAMLKADAMDWSNIGANPSKIKTDYVIAYLSLAAGKNLGGTFKGAKVELADSVEVGAIMSVEQRLLVATKAKLNVTTAWADFRKGDYASAKKILDGLGVTGVFPMAHNAATSGHPAGYFRIYSLIGQSLRAAKDGESLKPFLIYRAPE